jgi:UvrD/REP helicase N-terminal domain
VLYGNHDAENQITRRLTLPDNVRVFSTRKPETIRMDGCAVALHGQSFKQRAVTENLVPAYPQPVDGCFNIGVLHTGLGGMDGHANYAPCSLDDLVNKGYDYWALAHVHNGGVLHVHPRVVFCGNLQGRHVIRVYSSRERKEAQADVFAGEFLCPSDWLREQLLAGKRPADIAKDLELPDGLVMNQTIRALLLPLLQEPDAAQQTQAYELDESQLEAATWQDGPLLVDAGPGTGKTRTLVYRIQRLLEAGASPASILALTFSNKAAEEMRERLSAANPDAVRESGAKNATLVSVQDGVVRDVSTIETDVVRWTRLAVDVEGAAHCHDVFDRMRTAMEEKVAKNSGRLLACRIELTGRTALHDEISCSHERLIAEARAAALALGDEAAWVERLVIETTSAADALVPAIDALGELQAIVAEAPGDVDLCAQLDADIGELVRKLPHEIKIELEDGILKAAADRDHQQLISRASQYLAARLSQGV